LRGRRRSRPTEGELDLLVDLLEEFRACAREYGWKKEPGWVAELEGWMAKEED
jgi:hypothetical protein